MSTTLLAPRRLSAGEAEALWRGWKGGDAHSREQLVLAYMPMVRYIASRKVRELPDHCELDDLASSGLLALMEAVDRFDPDRGSFEQYAWTRVSGAVIDELRRQDWAPRSVRRIGRKIEHARDTFFARHGTLPNDVELADAAGISLAELRASADDRERADVLSLNAATRGMEEGVAVEVGDTIAAPPGEHDPDERAAAAERATVVREAIAALTERERTVLALVHVQELSGAEVGRMLGVTESRVSQIVGAIRKSVKARVDAYERHASGV
jgi:RNA polymerase sigma factor for flagellar operon FliA